MTINVTADEQTIKISLHQICFFRQGPRLPDREGRGPSVRPGCHGPGPPEADLLQRLQATLHHRHGQAEDGSHLKPCLAGSHLRNSLEYSEGRHDTFVL